MTSGTWLREHEALAAFIFIVISLTIMGVFTWVERRFFHKQTRGEINRGPFLNVMLLIGLRYAALKRKILAPPPAPSQDQAAQTAPETSSSVPASRR